MMINVSEWTKVEINQLKFKLAWIVGYKEIKYKVVFISDETYDRKVLIKIGNIYDIEWESSNEGYWIDEFTR